MKNFTKKMLQNIRFCDILSGIGQRVRFGSPVVGLDAAAGGNLEEKEMTAPQTYAEWSALLERFQRREKDEETLDAMRRGTVAWQSGVAERFSKKLIDAVNARMNAASDRFQRDLSHARGSDGEVVRALLALRREMSFLYSAVSLPTLPERERTQYAALVREQADNMQKSLEDSARTDRSGKMASLVRNNKVNAF